MRFIARKIFLGTGNVTTELSDDEKLSAALERIAKAIRSGKPEAITLELSANDGSSGEVKILFTKTQPPELFIKMDLK